jgi:bis(5'-nucleosyl)-tetraphosphatase (symmetrical)
MPVYAIGDVQGCFDELMGLLEKVCFDPKIDRLWFTGDLVNRGPDSLKVLRFVRDLCEQGAALTVLGNHDLHMLAVAEGLAPFHHGDTLDEIFAAPDREALLSWLRRQPLMHHDAGINYTLVHAGLPPQWDLAAAQACAQEVEVVLQGEDYRDFFAHMYGDEPGIWDDELTGWDRLRFITNCFTRLRFCKANGEQCLKAKGEPGTQPTGCLPWFEAPGRNSRELRVVFGHWSTLGLYRNNGVISLDTGCLWGDQLTAMRLDGDRAVFSYECPGYKRPMGLK